MKNTPGIVVQLVHIEGPLKGEVQEFFSSEILIGRHPSCHVQFPKDQVVISRKHTQIVREGNRFKVIDLSSNGTLVNGQFVDTHYVKNGDVIFITENGPKISFLTRKAKPGEKIESHELSIEPAIPEYGQQEAEPEPQSHVPVAPPQEPPAAKHNVPIREVQVPFVIQHGPNLHSFKKLPVTVGRGEGCDLRLDQPSILGKHVQFFFSENKYWAKDLTGQNAVTINEVAIATHSQLNENDRISLSSQGPVFKFIGGGRLLEIEEDQVPIEKSDEFTDETPPVAEKIDSPPEKQKKKGLFKSLSKIRPFS